MKAKFIGAIVIASCVVGCYSPPGDAGPPPTIYSVKIVSAVIGPSAPDGRYWDTSGVVATEFRDRLESIFGSTPSNQYVAAARLVSEVAALLTGGTEPPDVYGDVRLVINGMPIETFPLLDSDTNDEDSYMPNLGEVGWTGLSEDDDVQMTIRLWDEDFGPDDRIGTVVLGTEDFFAALDAGSGVYQVPVWDQFAPGNRMILYIGIITREVR